MILTVALIVESRFPPFITYIRSMPPQASKTEKPRATSAPRRRAWDSSLSDLSVYKPTKTELESRKAKMRSHNASSARAELDERQQRLAAGDFSEALDALQPDKLPDRSRPLDYESPRTAQRPKQQTFEAEMHIENVRPLLRQRLGHHSDAPELTAHRPSPPSH